MTFIRFYALLLLITLLQLGIIYLLPQVNNWADNARAIVFLAILTAAIYPIASVGIGSKNGYAFITTAYLSIGLRFMFSIGYIVYYKYTRTSFDKGFIILFFVSYIFYTVFEITSLTAKLRPDTTKK